MEIVAYLLRYSFVVVLAVAFAIIFWNLFSLAREKARPDAPPPAEE